MLGARLARVEHELLRAVALRVDVDEDQQPGLAQAAEAEVGHLDRVALRVGEDDARRCELLCRVGPRLALLRRE